MILLKNALEIISILKMYGKMNFTLKIHLKWFYNKMQLEMILL